MRAADPDQFAAIAADCVARRIGAQPHAVLALPTGSTPVCLYAELARRRRANLLSFDRARIFNLDEYCGMAATDPRSFGYFIDLHVVRPLGLAADRVCLLRGDAENLQEECRRVDAALERCGGIDLCILGLGVNGHIAFNEPGSSWHRCTHVVSLTQSTRDAQAAHAPRAWTVPAFGVTMGIATIRAAREVLLLIAGAGKDRAKRAWYRGAADADWPVTSLLDHPNLTTIELSVS